MRIFSAGGWQLLNLHLDLNASADFPSANIFPSANYLLSGEEDAFVTPPLNLHVLHLNLGPAPAFLRAQTHTRPQLRPRAPDLAQEPGRGAQGLASDRPPLGAVGLGA